MPRAPLRLALPCLTALACAGPAPLPPGVSAEPQRGDALPLLLTKLEHATDPEPRVEVRELLISAVERTPWQTLSPEAAAAHPGQVAVIAGRRCSWREGWERVTQDTGSWYLFQHNALVAFDHQGFGARCELRPAFEFLPIEGSDLERHLVRFLSQRYPATELPPDVHLARGLQLLARGRREEAQYEVYALDRRLRELRRLQSEDETPDAIERAEYAREEERLRPLRAKLAHALAADTKETESP